MLFLVEYDRASGTLLRLTQFPDALREEASNARLELEIQLLGISVVREVVLLEAASEDALRMTHDRYFKNVSDLATAGGTAVSARVLKDVSHSKKS